MISDDYETVGGFDSRRLHQNERENRDSHAGLSGSVCEPGSHPDRPKRPVCSRCGDTHVMLDGEDGAVPCTSCPVPCPKCACGSGHGAYCAVTPCPCSCHGAGRDVGPMGDTDFVGPCAHGRDPWERCETCSCVATDAASSILSLDRDRAGSHDAVSSAFAEAISKAARNGDECGPLVPLDDVIDFLRGKAGEWRRGATSVKGHHLPLKHVYRWLDELKEQVTR